MIDVNVCMECLSEELDIVYVSEHSIEVSCRECGNADVYFEEGTERGGRDD